MVFSITQNTVKYWNVQRSNVMSPKTETTIDDSGTTFQTVPNLRREQIERTGCITITFKRNISHLQKGYPRQQVYDQVGRSLYDWVNCFEDTGSMDIDVQAEQNGDQWVSVEKTVVLPDTDDDTIDRALAVTQIAQDSMQSAIDEHE